MYVVFMLQGLLTAVQKTNWRADIPVFFCVDGNEELIAYSSAVPFITPIVRK